jgi:agmatine/peptidylarginine deiminase
LVLEEFQTAQRLPNPGTQPSLHTGEVKATSTGSVAAVAEGEEVLVVVVAHQMEKSQAVLEVKFLRL